MLGRFSLEPNGPFRAATVWLGRGFGILVIVASALPLSGSAQRLAPGARVRLTVRDSIPLRFIGEFQRTAGDTVLLGVARTGPSEALLGQRRVLRLDLLRAEISLGQARDRGRSALIGGAIGAAAGVAAGLIEGPQPKCSGVFDCLFNPFSGMSRGELAAVVGLSYGLVGAGIGALVAPRVEKWRAVPITTVIAGDRGPAVALGVRVRLAQWPP